MRRIAIAGVAVLVLVSACGEPTYHSADNSPEIHESRFVLVSRDDIPGHASPAVTVFRDKYTGLCFISASSGSSEGGISIVQASVELCRLPGGAVERGR